MEHPENIEELVHEIAGISDALSEDETEQQTKEYLHQLQGMTTETINLTRKTVWRFRQAADTLDFLWKNCKKTHMAGTTAGILGGALSIGGGIATIFSAGAATPLLLLGIGLGFAGASTNVVVSYIEAAMNSNEIKKAEKEWQETVDRLNIMEKNLQEWMKKSGKLSVGVDDLLHLVRRLTPNGVAAFCALMAELQGTGQATAAGAQGAAKAGAPLADDALGAAAKAGAQSADDFAGAGAKVGAKALGKVIIGVSAFFLVIDVIDLGFTIKDLVEKNGSDAAMFLRAKADQLEEICSVR